MSLLKKKRVDDNGSDARIILSIMQIDNPQDFVVIADVSGALDTAVPDNCSKNKLHHYLSTSTLLTLSLSSEI